MAKSTLPRRDYSSEDYSLAIPEVTPVQADTGRQADTHTPAQSDSHTTKQASSGDPMTKRVKRRKPEPEPKPEIKAQKGYVQRPLYASEDMIQAFRKLTFETGKPAQEYYREGLLLRLQQEGLFKDLTFKDL